MNLVCLLFLNILAIVKSDILILPALGRLGRLGDLYDARTDAFSGFSVFKKPIPPSSIFTNDTPKDTSYSTKTNRLSDRINLIDIDASVKVSILAGLIEVSGSAEYLKENTKNTKSTQLTFSLTRVTSTKDLNIEYDELLPSYRIESIRDTRATHFISGIVWGANVFLTLDFHESSTLDIEKIKGSFQMHLTGKKIIDATGEAAGKILGHRKEEFDKTEIRLSTDLPLGEPVIDVQSAMDYIVSIPALIEKTNDGLGAQVRFKLSKITDLQKVLSLPLRQSVFSVNFDTVRMKAGIEIYEKFSDLSSQLRQLEQVMDLEPMPSYYSETVNLYKNMLGDCQNKYANEMKIYMASVRGGSNASADSPLIIIEKKVQLFGHNITTILETPELRNREQVFRIYNSSGIHYFGRTNTTFGTFLSLQKVFAIMLVDPFNLGPDRDNFMRMHFYFMRNLTEASRIAVDCTFEHFGCNEVQNTSIVEIEQGFIINHNVHPHSPKLNYRHGGFGSTKKVTKLYFHQVAEEINELKNFTFHADEMLKNLINKTNYIVENVNSLANRTMRTEKILDFYYPH